MKKTIKNVYIKQPHNYWINRRVYVDENDKILIKCNLDLLDTPIRASMVIGQGIKPEYKYDEYV